MPNQDRTGPLGQGPGSGGGLGRCNAGQRGPGRGQGQGGQGMGRNGFCARLGQGLRRTFRFGRFPRSSAQDQAPDAALERIHALEREIADLKDQLRNR